MSATNLTEFQAKKKVIREEAHRVRNELAEKDPLSLGICQTLVDSEEYQKANTILWYLDARSEVRTRHFIPSALLSSKKNRCPLLRGRFPPTFPSEVDGGPNVGYVQNP